MMKGRGEDERGAGRTDRQTERERAAVCLWVRRTDGQLRQRAAQPFSDCLQLFQLRLLASALLAQDLVLQPLVALLTTQHTCSKTGARAHSGAQTHTHAQTHGTSARTRHNRQHLCGRGPVFKHVTLSTRKLEGADELLLVEL